MSEHQEAERAMIRARTALVLRHCFFGALSLKLRMTADPACGTASVDGVTLRYAPDFVLAKTPDQRIGLIAHEVMHCAAGHFMRKGGRDHELFNIACDLAINPIIEGAGMELPPERLDDPAFHGMAAEEIYAKLLDRKQQQDQQQAGGGQPQPGSAGGQQGAGQPQQGAGQQPAAGDPDQGNFGGCGNFTAPQDPATGQTMTQAEVADLARQWQQATITAAAVAKAAGQMPGSAAELIESLKHSRVDWREALRRFVAQHAREDYGWSRPNRRYISQGVYLPSLRSERLGKIAWITDTSGSMDKPALERALTEFNAAIEDAQPEAVAYIEADTKVQAAEVYEPEDFPIRSITTHGRGGTSFRPAFDRLNRDGEEIVCAIYFTDMMPNDGWPDDPGFPVLWASTDPRITAPFGETIFVGD